MVALPSLAYCVLIFSQGEELRTPKLITVCLGDLTVIRQWENNPYDRTVKILSISSKHIDEHWATIKSDLIFNANGVVGYDPKRHNKIWITVGTCKRVEERTELKVIIAAASVGAMTHLSSDTLKNPGK